MPHSARKLPADLQAAMLKPDKPGPSIGKRRTKKAPKIPAWCPLPVTAWWDGRDSAAYQDALDRYCIETLEVSDPERRIMVYFDSATCSLCKNLPLRGGYTVCRHKARRGGATPPACRAAPPPTSAALASSCSIVLQYSTRYTII